MPNSNTCLIHIGKTGGTFVKESIRKSLHIKKAKEPHVLSNGLVLLGHRSLQETQKIYGDDHKFAFVFREPTERFVSAFYCRLRMGRPHHSVIWDAQESAAFAHFQTANDLAEALNSNDDYKKSAAIYSMNAIRHLKRGYAYHFGPSLIDFITQCETRLTCCVDLKNLNDLQPKFLEKLDIGAPASVTPERFSQHSKHDTDLSDHARENLQDFWHVEYSYYEIFKGLALK